MIKIELVRAQAPHADFDVRLPSLHSDQIKFYEQDIDDRVWDPKLTFDQRRAWAENTMGRFKALRCGRRWGKTVVGETWIGDGAVQGLRCAWFAPNYKYIREVFEDLLDILKPIFPKEGGHSKTENVMRTISGGLIDFWTLEDDRAGRSRRYDRVFVDEAAYGPKSALDTWEKSIKPTLLDTGGSAIVASNTRGDDEENFLWQLCNDPRHGFVEYHAPSFNNPTIPYPLPGEKDEDRALRRQIVFNELRAKEHPLVYRQEYLAEFVDWSGVAFFSLEKMLVRGDTPMDPPRRCDTVFAVMDTASKTGTDHDGTGVIYCSLNKTHPFPLVILDWDYVQIEGDLLQAWLPNVFLRCEELAKECGARNGVAGVWIEDASSGTILLQQALKKRMKVKAIDSVLTSFGKDERAISVSGYVFQGVVKIAKLAYEKTVTFKGATKNHLISQVTSFRVGDKDAAKRADDLLDTFCYAIALALGNKDAI